MEKPLFLQTTPPLLIAHLRNFPRLCWNGKQLVKGGNLIEFLGFGLVGLRFSEAALLNQGLMGLLGLSRRILQDKGDKSYASISNVTLGFDDKRVKTSKNGSSASSTENMQKAQGHILVKGQIVVSGVGSTQQVYKYKDNSFCYSRNISSSNYTIHYDKVSDSCPRSTLSRLPFSFGKFWSVPARRVSLASHFGDVKDGV
ncbi:hypothetical protein AABB24_020982 [Solanum stoloniferum]|uniref:Uncharacterized protein n=1 Tax=Solanum stoloniferum TaxID=62892 RepID=A0ABD2TB59_9SOLN